MISCCHRIDNCRIARGCGAARSSRSNAPSQLLSRLRSPARRFSRRLTVVAIGVSRCPDSGFVEKDNQWRGFRCCDSACGSEEAKADPRRRAPWVALIVNAAMFLVETVAGAAADSRALQADALDFLR